MTTEEPESSDYGRLHGWPLVNARIRLLFALIVFYGFLAEGILWIVRSV